MKNITDGMISTIRKGVDFLDETCNFCVPGIIKHIVKRKINGKLEVKTYSGDDSKDKLQISSKNCRWYIGKMFKEKANIYSKDSFWIGSLGYLFKKLKEGEKLTIIIAPSVSKYMNGEEDVEGAMSVEEQEDYITYLVIKNHRKYKKRLNIVNIESYHKELFEFLNNKGLHGLKSTKDPVLDKNKYTSLDIARYLYWVMQKHEKFYKEVADTKPSYLKKNNQMKIGCGLLWDDRNINAYIGLSQMSENTMMSK